MGKIVKVSGPLVVASGLSEANMADVVRVGEQHLIGEILAIPPPFRCMKRPRASARGQRS